MNERIEVEQILAEGTAKSLVGRYLVFVVVMGPSFMSTGFNGGQLITKAEPYDDTLVLSTVETVIVVKGGSLWVVV